MMIEETYREGLDRSGRLSGLTCLIKIRAYSSAAAASLAITFLRVAMPTTVPIIIAATITRLGATEIKLYLSIERSLLYFLVIIFCIGLIISFQMTMSIRT
ncbi:MAG: hypothetical protein ACJAZ4_002102 [Neptuniibacter pectenicola]|jgi:hypothetical protein